MKGKKKIFAFAAIFVILITLVSNIILIQKNNKDNSLANIKIDTTNMKMDEDESIYKLYKGEKISLPYSFISKNGKNIQKNALYEIEDSSVIQYNNEVLVGLSSGSSKLKIYSTKNPEIYTEIEILVEESCPNIILSNKAIVDQSLQIVVGNMDVISANADVFYDTSDYGWYSTDEEVVTVHDGYIYGKKIGNATIIYENIEHPENKSEIEIEVVSNYDKYVVKSMYIDNYVTLNSKDYTLTDFMNKDLFVGDYFTLRPVCYPYTSYGGFTAKSSDTSILTVNNSGRVNVKGIGTCRLTFTSFYYPDVSCFIDITTCGYNVKSLQLSATSEYYTNGEFYDSLIMKEDERVSYTLNVLPENAYNKDCSISCSNQNVEVQDGIIIAKQIGNTNITFKSITNNKIYKVLSINVISLDEDYIPPTSLKFASNQVCNGDNKTLSDIEKISYTGDFITLSYLYDMDTNLKDSVSIIGDSEYFDIQGMNIVLKKEGLVELTIKHQVYDLSDTIWIHIYQPFELSLNIDSSFIQDENLVLHQRDILEIQPISNYDAYYLKSSNTEIFKIENMNIRSLALGEADLYLYSSIDNKIYDSIHVKIEENPFVTAITSVEFIDFYCNDVLLENPDLKNKNNATYFSVGDVLQFSIRYQNSNVTLENAGYLEYNENSFKCLQDENEWNTMKIKLLKGGKVSFSIHYYDLGDKAFTIYLNVKNRLPEDISFIQPSYMITEEKFELNAKPKGTGYTYSQITYKSSNPKVATVKNGVITALGAGTTEIEMIIQDAFDSMKKSFSLVVYDRNVGKEVETLEIIKVLYNEEEISKDDGRLNGSILVHKEDKISIQIQIAPLDTTNGTPAYSCTNEKIVNIVASNKYLDIEMMKAGPVSITFTWNQVHTISYTISLKIQNDDFNPKIYNFGNIELNQKKKISYSIYKIDNCNVSFSVDDSSIAYVDSSGNVFGKSVGDTIVHVRFTDGVETEIIDVPIHVLANSSTGSEIIVNPRLCFLKDDENIEKQNIYIHTKEILPYSLVYDNRSKYQYYELIMNQDVSILDKENKTIGFLQSGEYDVLARFYDSEGIKEIGYHFIVEDIQPSFVIFDQPNGYLNIGDTYDLNLLVDKNATSCMIEYTFSNPNIVEIENHKIRAKSSGITKVTMHVKQDGQADLKYSFTCIVLDLNFFGRSFQNGYDIFSKFIVHFLLYFLLPIILIYSIWDIPKKKILKVLFVALIGLFCIILSESVCMIYKGYNYDNFKISLFSIILGILFCMIFLAIEKLIKRINTK